MIQKEEDTVVLLSSEEQQGGDKHVLSSFKENSFIASSFGASCLCGAGLFISNFIMWCGEPKVACKDTEIIRFSVLVGGIISSLITGRAVDFYGRRSSLIFAVLCWLIATLFLTFSPLHFNSQYLPHTQSQNFIASDIAPLDATTMYHINSLENHVTSSDSQISVDLNLSLTKSLPVISASFLSNGPHINFPKKINNNISFGNSLLVTSNEIEENGMNSRSDTLVADKQFSSLIPFVVSYLFIGAASTASITSASVYVYETSQTNSRARWLSFADFFSALFALSLPLFNNHMLIFTTSACLPIIIISLFMFLPFSIPKCLSMPQSPYYLLLCSIVHKKNLLSSKSSQSLRVKNFDKVTVRATSDNNQKLRASNNIFHSYGKIAVRIVNKFRTPFNTANNKIYDVHSRKSSASESDDSSCSLNDVVKLSEAETELEKLQPVQIEKQGWAESVHYKKSYFDEDDELFLGECSKSLNRSKDETLDGVMKDLEVDVTKMENEDDSVISFDINREDMDVPFYRSMQLESNECNEDDQLEENSNTSIQEKCRESLKVKVMWQEVEAHNILTHLYGSRKGKEEWEEIQRTFIEDVDSKDIYANKSFFVFDLLNFRPTFGTVSKIGLPLMIIHMCASDIGTTLAVSESIFTKMKFCDVSAQTTISSLQVLSTGISMLLLDKIGNQIVLLGAAMVMAASLMALGFLSPYIKLLANDSPSSVVISTVTPTPPMSTIYPLLPTPLPQIYHNEINNCIEDQLKKSSFNIIDHVDNPEHGHTYASYESPIVWLTAIFSVSSIVTGSLILAPLTRLTLLSALSTYGRGSGIGISFAIQYAIRLIVFFLPGKLQNSSLGLVVYAGTCFVSITMLLCFLGIKNQTKCCCPQHSNYNRRFFHLLSDSKNCNMSALNSTAV